jgi:HAD superfamily hydrolase (TIGR01549 family)
LIKAVIFDLDGTLINLPVDYEKLFHEFSKIMRTVDVRPLTKTIPKLNEETRKKVFEVWDKAELEALEDMTPNAQGTAQYKKFSKEPKILVTMQGKAVTQMVLKRLGLSFNAVVTREYSLDRVKQLKTAAEKLKKETNDILFIGNTDEDLLAAETVGCQFLRVT